MSNKIDQIISLQTETFSAIQQKFSALSPSPNYPSPFEAAISLTSTLPLPSLSDNSLLIILYLLRHYKPSPNIKLLIENPFLSFLLDFFDQKYLSFLTTKQSSTDYSAQLSAIKSHFLLNLLASDSAKQYSASTPQEILCNYPPTINRPEIQKKIDQINQLKALCRENKSGQRLAAYAYNNSHTRAVPEFSSPNIGEYGTEFLMNPCWIPMNPLVKMEFENNLMDRQTIALYAVEKALKSLFGGRKNVSKITMERHCRLLESALKISAMKAEKSEGSGSISMEGVERRRQFGRDVLALVLKCVDPRDFEANIAEVEMSALMVSILCYLNVASKKHFELHCVNLLRFPPNITSVEFLQTLVRRGVILPKVFVVKYITFCVHYLEQKKILSVVKAFALLIIYLIQVKKTFYPEILIELQTFCIAFSKMGECVKLFKLLKNYN